MVLLNDVELHVRDKLENLEEQIDKLQEHLDKMEDKLEKIIYDNKEYNFEELISSITRLEDLINNSLTEEIKCKENKENINTESFKIGYFSYGILFFFLVHVYCCFIQHFGFY